MEQSHSWEGNIRLWNFPPFMEIEGLLTSSQESAT
jgi:hypothetical protein